MGRRQPWDVQAWVRSYEAAVLEVDAKKVPQRIQVAEAAISSRLVELMKSTDHDEPDALHDALRVLQLIAKHEHILKDVA